ncbi:hypothetical protein QYE76_040718 [Lolium multiflorum]|uniref:Retrotransposon gag domain-containing protein n=1 Tax=Lolium multiflorum TaxID=4521 RepID=A0AAD8TC56_LOLMU|nr:hypothetical protein QYE76_040718 [Lolium multiflorum]
MKETIKTQEDQLRALEGEGEGEGENIPGDGYSYASNEENDDLEFYPYGDDTAPINIAQNNQGHRNYDHPGSKLKKFQNTNPPVFSKTEEPLDANDWLHIMENNLEVAGVEANDKVLFATHYLAGPARAWWTSAHALNAGQLMNWADFKLKFSKYHVPRPDQEDEG